MKTKEQIQSSSGHLLLLLQRSALAERVARTEAVDRGRDEPGGPPRPAILSPDFRRVPVRRDLILLYWLAMFSQIAKLKIRVLKSSAFLRFSMAIIRSNFNKRRQISTHGSSSLAQKYRIFEKNFYFHIFLVAKCG
jgi:hypothetical protein